MPSPDHENLLDLFRNRPSLAAELLRDALKMDVPPYTEARIDSPDLTETTPTEYRADLVVRLLDGGPVLGMVIEVQLSPDERKRFSWPAYVTGLRARLECPVCLMVVTIEESIARWARKPTELGGGNWFTPLVLGPSTVPQITDERQAIAAPELAVLSVMTHGQDEDAAKAVQIAIAADNASRLLDEERIWMYRDLIRASLSDAAKRVFQTMDPARYEPKSDIARHYLAEGRAAMVVKLLSSRYGILPAQVTERIGHASIEELDAIGERLLTAKTLAEALDQK